MTKTVTIHQPQYIPWVPYFDKVLQSDIFVLLDNVQFQKNGLQNRNKIKTSNGVIWLTVPVNHSFGQTIQQTKIADVKALKKHIKTLEFNYTKSSFFQEVFAVIQPALDSHHVLLSDLNVDLIRHILGYLDYEGEIVLASSLSAQGQASDLILSICQELNAEVYLSGSGGKNYLREDDFKNAGIQVVYQGYQNIDYPQLFPEKGFAADLSLVDLLFNVGKKSLDFIKKGRLS